MGNMLNATNTFDAFEPIYWFIKAFGFYASRYRVSISNSIWKACSMHIVREMIYSHLRPWKLIFEFHPPYLHKDARPISIFGFESHSRGASVDHQFVRILSERRSEAIFACNKYNHHQLRSVAANRKRHGIEWVSPHHKICIVSHFNFPPVHCIAAILFLIANMALYRYTWQLWAKYECVDRDLKLNFGIYIPYGIFAK